MISGSYIGEESLVVPAAQALLQNVMHASYDGFISDWDEQGINGLGLTLDIPRWINPEQYPVVHPETLIPMDDKAFTPFVYENSRRSAAVAYTGDDYRSVLLGFPFEAIRSSIDRDIVMSSLLEFLMKKE